MVGAAEVMGDKRKGAWKWRSAEEREALRERVRREVGASDWRHYDDCPKCGGLKKTESKRCQACYRVEPKRRWSKDPRAGRMQAKAAFPIEGLCRRCEQVPARDRHHQDGDVFNNTPENILLVCRRCHLELEEKVVRRGLDEVVPMEEYIMAAVA